MQAIVGLETMELKLSGMKEQENDRQNSPECLSSQYQHLSIFNPIKADKPEDSIKQTKFEESPIKLALES